MLNQALVPTGSKSRVTVFSISKSFLIRSLFRWVIEKKLKIKKLCKLFQEITDLQRDLSMSVPLSLKLRQVPHSPKTPLIQKSVCLSELIISHFGKYELTSSGMLSLSVHWPFVSIELWSSTLRFAILL